MQTIFFILGRNSELSAAEISAKLKQLNISHRVTASEKDFVFVEAEEPDYKYLQQQLAGTIKIGVIVQELQSISATELSKIIPMKDTKVNFGLSFYNCKGNIDGLGREIKKILKADDIKSRFVASKQYPLSSVIVQKNLINKGVEIVVFKTDTGLFLGRTITVQDFEYFSDLDFGRPDRDSEIGMLPPKLAQMMINLAEAPFDQNIYDPFCGAGTVLQQAINLGYKNVIGSDVNEKQIQASLNNLQWLEKKIETKISADIFHSDIKNITSTIKPQTIDNIVCEPHMGPPIKGYETPDKIKVITNELENLYKATFGVFETILKNNGTIIFVLPEFKIRDRIYRLDLNKIMPKSLRIIQSLPYSRPDQFVIRNILKIKKI